MPATENRPVALVTGAGARRVGRTIALELATRGYDLAVHYRSSAADAAATVAELLALGVQADAFAADLADSDQVTNLVSQVQQRFGKINVLVNAAAIWERKPLEQVTADDVRRHFDTNALAVFLLCQQVGLLMTKQQSGGCIVNIGDWAEIRPYPDYAAYFPSKGAVTTLTRSMAVELARRNPLVRVNCVLPGPVMLPPDLPIDERNAAIARTLVKREGSPRHVALAVCHLIENDFITGVCLPVDGGRSLQSDDER